MWRGWGPLRQWMNRYTMVSFDWCHVSFLILRQTKTYHVMCLFWSCFTLQCFILWIIVRQLFEPRILSTGSVPRICWLQCRTLPLIYHSNSSYPGSFPPPLWTMPWGHCTNVLRFFIVFGALSTTEVSCVTHLSDIVSGLQAASLKAGTCVSSVRCTRSQRPLR